MPHNIFPKYYQRQYSTLFIHYLKWFLCNYKGGDSTACMEIFQEGHFPCTWGYTPCVDCFIVHLSLVPWACGQGAVYLPQLVSGIHLSSNLVGKKKKADGKADFQLSGLGINPISFICSQAC